METYRSDLWEAYQSGGDLGVRNRLVEHYQVLAARIARGFETRRVASGSGGSVGPDDLVGLARERMMRAVSRPTARLVAERPRQWGGPGGRR